MANALALGPALVANDSPTQPQPQGNPSQPAGNDLATKWNDWLSQPGNRNALIQFGVNMLQPIQSGQTLGGQIGQAVGEGMAARDRSIATSQQAEISRAAEQRLEAEQQSNATEAAARGKQYSAMASYYGFGGSQGARRTGLSDAEYMSGFKAFMESAYPFVQIDPSDPAAVKPYQQQYDAFLAARGGQMPAGGAGAPTLKPMPAEMLTQARQALAAGKDRNGVIAKIQQLGYDPSPLGQ